LKPLADNPRYLLYETKTGACGRALNSQLFDRAQEILAPRRSSHTNQDPKAEVDPLVILKPYELSLSRQGSSVCELTTANAVVCQCVKNATP